MRPLGGYRPSCPLAALALGGAAALVGSPWINVGPFSSMLHLGIVLLVRLTGGTGMVAVRPLGWIDLLLVLVGTVLAAAPLAVLAQFVGNRTSSFHAPLPALLLALVARLGVPMAAELAGGDRPVGHGVHGRHSSVRGLAHRDRDPAPQLPAPLVARRAVVAGLCGPGACRACHHPVGPGRALCGLLLACSRLASGPSGRRPAGRVAARS